MLYHLSMKIIVDLSFDLRQFKEFDCWLNAVSQNSFRIVFKTIGRFRRLKKYRAFDHVYKAI